jgi:hypothetical protein
MQHTDWLWKENKKQQNTLSRKPKRDRSWETTLPVTACAGHAPRRGPPLQQKIAGRPPNHQETTHHTLEDKPWPTRAERGESARPWLEAAGPEEAGDPCGKVRALRKPTRESRSDYKENPKQIDQVRKTPPEEPEKIAPQPRTVKSYCQGTTTIIGSNPGGTNSTALKTGKHLNSTGSNQGGTKTSPKGQGEHHHRGREA